MFEEKIKAIKQLATWFKSIPSEADGSGSASRIMGLLCIIAAVGAFIFHVYANHGLPSHDQMLGLGVLLGAGQIAYAANQAKAALTEKTPQPIIVQAPDGSTHAVGFVTGGGGEDEESNIIQRPRIKGR